MRSGIVSCFLLDLWGLTQCLVHRRTSKNICWISHRINGNVLFTHRMKSLWKLSFLFFFPLSIFNIWILILLFSQTPENRVFRWPIFCSRNIQPYQLIHKRAILQRYIWIIRTIKSFRHFKMWSVKIHDY